MSRMRPNSSEPAKRGAGSDEHASIIGDIAFAVFAIALALVARIWGPGLSVVYTSSMVPTYWPGDMVVVMPWLRPDVGDIVVFQTPMSPGDPRMWSVGHRIIGQDANGFITKGDATPQDWWRVRPEQITGEVIWWFPKTWLYRCSAVLIGLALTIFLWPVRQDDSAEHDAAAPATREPEWSQ